MCANDLCHPGPLLFIPYQITFLGPTKRFLVYTWSVILSQFLPQIGMRESSGMYLFVFLTNLLLFIGQAAHFAALLFPAVNSTSKWFPSDIMIRLYYNTCIIEFWMEPFLAFRFHNVWRNCLQVHGILLREEDVLQVWEHLIFVFIFLFLC